MNALKRVLITEYRTSIFNTLSSARHRALVRALFSLQIIEIISAIEIEEEIRRDGKLNPETTSKDIRDLF